jgi:hypothetical protein
VNAVSSAGNFPIAKLFVRSMQQPGIPRQRHTYGSSVPERNAERIGGKGYPDHPLIRMWKAGHATYCSWIRNPNAAFASVMIGLGYSEFNESVDTQTN